jgi:hypothetical protein
MENREWKMAAGPDAAFEIFVIRHSSFVIFAG